MAPPVHPPRSSGSQDATAGRENDLAYIGRPNSAGLFYAARSRNYDEEICGCPLCRQAAHDGD